MFDFSQKLILKNKTVQLEPLELVHAEALSDIALRYPNLLTYSPSPFGSEKNIRLYILATMEAKYDKSKYAFVIRDLNTSKLVGSTSYGNISSRHKKLEIGWTWISPEVQRSGLNRNCKFLLLQHAFEHLNCERVEFKTDARNEQSRNAIEGIGGVYEGLHRQDTTMLDGSRRDTVYYSILKSEWCELKTTLFKPYCD